MLDNYQLLTAAGENAKKAGAINPFQQHAYDMFVGRLNPEQQQGLINTIEGLARANVYLSSVGVAIDWERLFTTLLPFLTPILSLIPGVGPILPMILPFILDLIRKNLPPNPWPNPNPQPNPNPNPFPAPTPI